MGELNNCPSCDAVFVETSFRDVCGECFKQEEVDFEKAYDFIKKRENRTATMDEVTEATNVTQDLLIKYIKKGRLRLAQFPNLGYPCERCGTFLREGKLCIGCREQLTKDLQQHTNDEKRQKDLLKQEQKLTYYTFGGKKGSQ